MSKPFHKNVRFCPKCGVDSLERDYFRQSPPQPGGGDTGKPEIKNGTEYWCRTCGFGFAIHKSARTHLAEDLLKRERQQRNQVMFSTACVGPQIAEAFHQAEQEENSRLGPAHVTEVTA